MAEEIVGDEFEEEGKEQERKSEKKSKPVMLIAIIGVAVLLLGGGAFAAIQFGLFDGEEEADVKEIKDNNMVQMDLLNEEPGPLLALDSFIVNLAETGSSRYLKTSIQIELGSQALVTHVEARMPQIRDTLLTLLSNKTIPDIKDVKGKLKLRKEIVQRLNEILGEGAISQVFFTEFIIQ